MKKQLNILIDEKDKEILFQIAKEKGLTITQYCRMIILEKIK